MYKPPIVTLRKNGGPLIDGVELPRVRDVSIAQDPDLNGAGLFTVTLVLIACAIEMDPDLQAATEEYKAEEVPQPLRMPGDTE